MFPAALEKEILDVRDEDRFLDPSRPVLIYGTGNFATAVACALLGKGIMIAGFVETTPSKTEWLGLPVVAAAQANLTADDQLAIGIFNRDVAYDEISVSAISTGSTNIFWPFDYYGQISDDLGWRFWLASKEQASSELAEIKAAFHLLSDDESRRTFSSIIRFRLGLEPGYSSFQHEETQYFCDITLPLLARADLVYVDAGAYDGDSWRELCKHARPTEGWLLEPDPRNYARLVELTRSDCANLRRLPLGLSDGHHVVSFSDNGEGSMIVSNGANHIVTASLDDILGGARIDFLKMDIEGSEIAALHGARETIVRSRPVMCISLYHRPADLWQIPLLINSMVGDYAFAVRQHMFNSFESVLYAIPR